MNFAEEMLQRAEELALAARITMLEAQLENPAAKRGHRSSRKAAAKGPLTDAAHNKLVKAQEKAQRKVWKYEAWERSRLGTALNRYKL